MTMEISVIILNWNGFKRTCRCLDSLREATDPACAEIIVVDNGSTDGSGEMLREHYPGVRHLANKENLGFSAGVNVGLRDAFHRGCQMFLLLNSDMIVERRFLDPARAILNANQTIGIVTGKILQLLPAGIIWHAGGHVNKFKVAGIPRGYLERDVGQYDNDCDTEWASGAMCLVARRAVERAGFLPEEYFFGQEEWDYSTNVIRNGFRIRYCPDFVGVHEQGSSHKDGHPILSVYSGVRNRFIYAQRNLPSWHVALLRIYYCLYLVSFWPLRAKYGCRTPKDFWARYRAAWLGYIDQFTSHRVDLETLRTAQEKIGISDSWGTSWMGD